MEAASFVAAGGRTAKAWAEASRGQRMRRWEVAGREAAG